MNTDENRILIGVYLCPSVADILVAARSSKCPNWSCGSALSNLKPLNRQTYGDVGAFTNIVTWASDFEGFRQKASVVAASIDMYVMNIENAEPLAERVKCDYLWHVPQVSLR
jgi:hypothetical protein